MLLRNQLIIKVEAVTTCASCGIYWNSGVQTLSVAELLIFLTSNRVTMVRILSSTTPLSWLGSFIIYLFLVYGIIPTSLPNFGKKSTVRNREYKIFHIAFYVVTHHLSKILSHWGIYSMAGCQVTPCLVKVELALYINALTTVAHNKRENPDRAFHRPPPRDLICVRQRNEWPGFCKLEILNLVSATFAYGSFVTIMLLKNIF